MAIYHFEAKIISRGTGRSAVAAAAYLSCSRMYNEYDGIRHDYTRKGGLIFREVMLPTNAPATWNDREQLWNAVELTEPTKDSRLAREMVLALPVELDKYSNLKLLRAFVREAFVDKGMCADFAIHNTDGHNPHAHVMLTMRPLNEDGTWQYKTEKEYLCIRGGEEKGFTAEEFKKASTKGWEKQYLYKVGRKKVYMTPSAAEKEGYKRADKHPKSTRFGRQNPISAQWNSEEQLIAWRAQWANAVNLALEKAQVQDRVDHRSHAERGIDEQPTVHEGVSARIMEQKGVRAERTELNRQIKADNKALRELKTTISRLMRAAKEKLNIPAIAEALVELRTSILHNLYRLIRAGEMLKEAKRDIATYEPGVKRYYEIGDEIKKSKADMKLREDEKRKRQEKQSAFSKTKERVMAMLSDAQEDNPAERIEELRSERKAILSRHGLRDKDEMKVLKHNLGVWKKNKSTLEEVSGKWEKQVTADTDKYRALRADVPNERLAELDTQCAEIYQSSKYERRDSLQTSYKSRDFDHDLYWKLEKQVDNDLEVNTILEKEIYQSHQQQKIKKEVIVRNEHNRHNKRKVSNPEL